VPSSPRLPAALRRLVDSKPWRARWEEQVERVDELLEQLLPSRDRDGRPQLPCDLYLTMAHTSLLVFPAGPIEEPRFFERRGVSAHHELEFLARRDPGASSDDLRPFAMFRLGARRGLPLEAALPRGSTPSGLWLRPGDPSGRDPGLGSSWAERVALMERSRRRPTRTREVVHRYYLDPQLRPYLVRDHPTEGRRLYAAQLAARHQDQAPARPAGRIRSLLDRVRKAA
jgi:hypothetical protein